ncbi:MAG: hypothetical protein ACTSR2_00490 [Candidatus Hodarchaeales archaeon]
MKDIKRIERVLKEVLEEKKDNLVKLRIDLNYRLEMASQWKKKYDALKEELERIRKDLSVLQITKGQSSKTKEKILNLESRAREINEELRKLENSLNEAPFIVDTLVRAKEFVDLIDKAIKNPERFYKRTNDYIEKEYVKKKGKINS